MNLNNTSMRESTRAARAKISDKPLAVGISGAERLWIEAISNFKVQRAWFKL